VKSNKIPKKFKIVIYVMENNEANQKYKSDGTRRD
jgi:hypothetical protein